MRHLSQRFRELVLSVYLYNEYRGYLQLETELIPHLESDPRFDTGFIEGVKKHAADERRHYSMFKGWFRERQIMPFAVGKAVGYFDALASVLVAKRGPEDPAQIVADEKRFAKLCRAVVMTERRGISQLDTMLTWQSVRTDERLLRIFETIRRDEPSHFGPYETWLSQNGLPGPSWRERAADLFIHYTIALLIPFLFLNPRLRRLQAFQE